MEKNKVLDPLNGYQLLQEVSGGSYFFANVDTVGVEGTSTLVNSAKPYIINEETGEPGVVTGEPLNAVPRGDLDKNTYDNTSDVYYFPEYTYVEGKETSGDTSGDTSGNTSGDTSGDTSGNTSGDTSGNTSGDTSGDTNSDESGNTPSESGVTSGDTVSESGDTSGNTSSETTESGNTSGDTVSEGGN